MEWATLLLPANKSEAQPASPMLCRATTSTTIPPIIQDILVVIFFGWMKLTYKITAINWATVCVASFLSSVTIRDRYSEHITLDHQNFSSLHTPVISTGISSTDISSTFSSEAFRKFVYLSFGRLQSLTWFFHTSLWACCGQNIHRPVNFVQVLCKKDSGVCVGKLVSSVESDF